MAAKPAIERPFLVVRRKAATCLLLLTFFCAFLAATTSHAQMLAPSAPEAPTAEEQAAALEQSTPEERAELLSRLSDAQVRSLLLDYLALRQQQAADASSFAIDNFDRNVQRFRQGIEAQLAEAYILPTLPGFLYDKLSEGRGPYHPLIVLAALLAIGLIAKAS